MTDPRHDLDELAARLERERPDLSPAAYERIRDRVVGGVPQRRRTSRASIATALALALGIFMTGGGASLAISGLASDTTAVQAQYQVAGAGTTETTPAAEDESAVAGESDENDPSLGGTAGETDAGEEAAQAPVQVAVASGDDELPFTGFAAIPIVIAGALLIAVGALLRRRTT
jgi:hypothetical protein